MPRGLNARLCHAFSIVVIAHAGNIIRCVSRVISCVCDFVCLFVCLSVCAIKVKRLELSTPKPANSRMHAVKGQSCGYDSVVRLGPVTPCLRRYNVYSRRRSLLALV